MTKGISGKIRDGFKLAIHEEFEKLSFRIVGVSLLILAILGPTLHPYFKNAWLTQAINPDLRLKLCISATVAALISLPSGCYFSHQAAKLRSN